MIISVLNIEVNIYSLDYLKYILNILRLLDKTAIDMPVTMSVHHYILSKQYFTFCKYFCSVYFTGVLTFITSVVTAVLTNSA
jgi:hypothetical protein